MPGITVSGIDVQGLDVALLLRDALAVDGTSSLIAQAEPSILEFGIDVQGLEVALLFLLLQFPGSSKHTCIWDRCPRP